MTKKTEIVETIPFNFDEVYEGVRNKFEEYGYDLQEGSNTMQLAIAMSYMISSLNANTAININEMLLPLARKRKMVLKDARLLGYEIQKVLSYKYRLTIDFPEGIHVINRYEKFTSGGKTYYYMGDSIPAFNGPSTQVIDVIEGDLITYQDDPVLDNIVAKITNKYLKEEFDYFYDIPYEDVEEDGVEVFVTYYNRDGTLYAMEPWSRTYDYLIDKDTVINKTFVRLDNTDTGTPRVYFNLGGVGKDLRENTQVRINILVSSGEDGEIEDINDPESLSTDLDAEITEIKLIRRGTREESSDSIKRNAPLFYNSANRLVVKNDYLAFINRDNAVKHASTWDGGDEYPTKPGHIWLSYIPRHTYRNLVPNGVKTKWTMDKLNDLSNWYLEDTDIQRIGESMEKLRIPTLIFHHRHPIYMDFDYKIRIIRYNRSMSLEDRNTEVFNILDQYFVGSNEWDGAETYEFEYFQSNLDKRIDINLTDETGFEIDLKTSITLSEKNITTEITDLCNPSTDSGPKVRFHLGTPFEKYLINDEDGSRIDHTVLPVISAKVGSKDLKVDFGTGSPVSSSIYSYDVKLGSTVVGEYRVFTGFADTIEVILNASNDLKATDIEGLNIEVEYVSPNFRLTRNTVPRLKTVELITR